MKNALEEGKDMAQPTVSIITPMFNVEDYVGDAVRSLLGQTYGDFEAIFVDDGSTDATVQVVSDAAGADPRFRIVRQQNAGPASARNRGIDEAQGRYLMFLDADDWLADGALDDLVRKAREENLDYLDFNARTVYEDPRLRMLRDESFYEGRTSIDGVMTGQELFCAFQANREYCCSLCLHFFERSLLERSGLRLAEGMYVHEDELFSPLLISYARRAAFLNAPLYQRRVRPSSSMTSGRSMRNVISMFEAAQGIKAWLEGNFGACTERFKGALAARISELYRLAAEDARGMDPDELVDFASSLPPARRIDFEVCVIQQALHLEEFYGSHTYRAGEALLALPKALRAAANRVRATRSG